LRFGKKLVAMSTVAKFLSTENDKIIVLSAVPILTAVPMVV